MSPENRNAEVKIGLLVTFLFMSSALLDYFSANGVMK